MKSPILNSKFMEISPKKFMGYCIRKTMKKLKEEPGEVTALFDQGKSWNRGLILTITSVDSYHFTCKFIKDGPKFIYLKGKPLKPFPHQIKEHDADELARITLSKGGPYANVEVVMPYETFLMLIAKEVGPVGAGKKSLLKLHDYDGWGSQYHATFMAKFYYAVGDAVNILGDKHGP